jgi:hypothetical protein
MTASPGNKGYPVHLYDLSPFRRAELLELLCVGLTFSVLYHLNPIFERISVADTVVQVFSRMPN